MAKQTKPATTAKQTVVAPTPAQYQAAVEEATKGMLDDINLKIQQMKNNATSQTEIGLSSKAVDDQMNNLWTSIAASVEMAQGVYAEAKLKPIEKEVEVVEQAVNAEFPPGF